MLIPCLLRLFDSNCNFIYIKGEQLTSQNKTFKARREGEGAQYRTIHVYEDSGNVHWGEEEEEESGNVEKFEISSGGRSPENSWSGKFI